MRSVKSGKKAINPPDSSSTSSVDEPANNRQVGGTHYKEGTDEQCWKLLRQQQEPPQHWDLVCLFSWDYFQGQIIKYIMRWKAKNGLEDLKKARHFLDKYIEIAEEAATRDT